MPDYDDDDEYSHGSDCNCAGDSDNDDDEYGEDDDLENQGEQEDEGISMEEAIFTMKQLVDQLAQLIGRLEGEIDKCKKARGPQMKKMKDRVPLLGTKVDHARVIKAKVEEIHIGLVKDQLEPSIIVSLKLALADYL
jgi:hypothetical protein